MFISNTAIFLYSLFQVTSCYNEKSSVMTNWTTSNAHFPVTDENSIVVFDNITRYIWIIGGLTHSDNIYKYNIDREILTLYVNAAGVDFGYNYVNNVNSVIINRTIYWMTQNKVSTLNIDTMLYTPNIGLSLDGETNMCLVTDRDETKLYLASGYWYKKFIIWDLETSTQITGAPDTNEVHTGGVCQVIDNILYVMSGYHSQIIEYIDLNTINNNVTNAKWSIINDTFPENLYSSSSAVWNDLIFVMGAGTSHIFSFNVSSQRISNYGTLPSNIGYAPAICVESRIYIFMGDWQIQSNALIYADLLLLTDATSVPTTNVPSGLNVLSISTHTMAKNDSSSTGIIYGKDPNTFYIIVCSMTVCMVAVIICIGYKMRQTKQRNIAMESTIADTMTYLKTKSDLNLPPTASKPTSTTKVSDSKEEDVPTTVLSMAPTNSLEIEQKSNANELNETTEHVHERLTSKSVVIVYTDKKENDCNNKDYEQKLNTNELNEVTEHADDHERVAIVYANENENDCNNKEDEEEENNNSLADTANEKYID